MKALITTAAVVIAIIAIGVILVVRSRKTDIMESADDLVTAPNRFATDEYSAKVMHRYNETVKMKLKRLDEMEQLKNKN